MFVIVLAKKKIVFDEILVVEDVQGEILVVEDVQGEILVVEDVLEVVVVDKEVLNSALGKDQAKVKKR